MQKIYTHPLSVSRSDLGVQLSFCLCPVVQLDQQLFGPKRKSFEFPFVSSNAWHCQHCEQLRCTSLEKDEFDKVELWDSCCERFRAEGTRKAAHSYIGTRLLVSIWALVDQSSAKPFQENTEDIKQPQEVASNNDSLEVRSHVKRFVNIDTTNLAFGSKQLQQSKYIIFKCMKIEGYVCA